MLVWDLVKETGLHRRSSTLYYRVKRGIFEKVIHIKVITNTHTVAYSGPFFLIDVIENILIFPCWLRFESSNTGNRSNTHCFGILFLIPTVNYY